MGRSCSFTGLAGTADLADAWVNEIAGFGVAVTGVDGGAGGGLFVVFLGGGGVFSIEGVEKRRHITMSLMDEDFDDGR